MGNKRNEPLRALRLQAGLTHIQLAEVANIKATTFARWESGRGFAPDAGLHHVVAVLFRRARRNGFISGEVGPIYDAVAAARPAKVNPDFADLV